MRPEGRQGGSGAGARVTMPAMSRFLEAVRRGVVVGDGGMGSMLHTEGVDTRGSLEALCLTQPDRVLAVHLKYIQAGAHYIETHTFGATRHKLAELGLGDAVARVNSAAVKLAREARDISGRDVFVAGSIGPSWMPYDTDDPDAADRLRALFREQAEALDARGIDLFVLETFGSIWELERALEAVRSVSSLPLIASATFSGDQWEDKEDEPGPTRVAARLAALGADVIGANCTVGPRDMLTILEGMRRAGVGPPLAVAPNTGVPRMVDGRFIYPDSSPEYFAWFAREAVRRGARVIAGCCGTTPAHVQAVAEAVRALDPNHAGTPVIEAPPAPRLETEPTERVESGLARKLAAGQFVVSMQIDPPKGTNASAVLDAVRAFRASGRVDTVDINSNPMAHLHMDSLWMAVLCERLGMETIPHITPRDASTMGIQAGLMGAWCAGVKNLLVITGDPSQSGDFPGKTDVYQTDSIGLVREIRDLNAGRDCAGNVIGDPPSFLIGVAVNPTEPNLEHEIERFRRKVEAGARYAMTQIFFEWAAWDRFLEAYGEPLPIPVLAAVWPLTSYKLAVRLHNEVPGILIPPFVLELLDKAGPHARREGFALARELLQEARQRVAGAYVIAPFKSPASALELLA